MDDAGTMRPVERVADLDGDPERVGDGNRSLASQPIGERLAFEKFQDEKIGVAFTPDVEERADVRMLQARNGARFAVESFGKVRRQDLDRDGAIEPRIARAIDLAHAAGSERRDDLVRPEAYAGRNVHG